MKTCPNCQHQLPDDSSFCAFCGTNFAGNNANSGTQYGAAPTQVAVDPYDHTAEFDPKDISDNKVMAMLVYLMGWIGIIIALLGCQSSPYVSFHVRQALKFDVVNILMWIASLLFCWTFIAPIAAMVMTLVFFVIRIICFFQICSGKAKEPAIIRSLDFLK